MLSISGYIPDLRLIFINFPSIFTNLLVSSYHFDIKCSSVFPEILPISQTFPIDFPMKFPRMLNISNGFPINFPRNLEVSSWISPWTSPWICAGRSLGPGLWRRRGAHRSRPALRLPLRGAGHRSAVAGSVVLAAGASSKNGGFSNRMGMMIEVIGGLWMLIVINGG